MRDYRRVRVAVRPHRLSVADDATINGWIREPSGRTLSEYATSAMRPYGARSAQLGFIPGVVAAASSVADIGSVVGSFTSGISNLFGDTPTDKRRKADAAANLQRALGGDRAALQRLLYEAFEKRGAKPGDTRTPSDGKWSPSAVRELAKNALQKYVSAVGGLPMEFSAYASKLGTAALTPQSVAEAMSTFPGAPFAPSPSFVPGGSSGTPAWVIPTVAAGGAVVIALLLTRGK